MLLPCNSRHWRDGLAPGQFRLFLAIVELHASGTPVTYRKLIRRLGLRSPTAVQQSLDKLERLGLVRRSKGHAASLVPCYNLERIAR